MTQRESASPLSKGERMEVFLALVEAQDGAMTVAQSRQAVSKQFNVSLGQLRSIEREGLDCEWPPL